MSDREFTPREAMERVLAHWWIVLIMAVIGGVAGWIFHFFQSPVYEASAGITVNTLFRETDLSQYELDLAFGAAGTVIRSAQVFDKFSAEAQARGLSSTEISWVWDNSSREAVKAMWVMNVRYHDPEMAAELANLWAGIAEQALLEDIQHALRADQLQEQISSLQSCLPAATPAPLLTPEACESYSLDELQAKVQAWSSELANEQNLSQGVLSGTSIALTRFATVSETPVLYGRGSLVFAGACIGFVISLWVTNIRKRQRRV